MDVLINRCSSSGYKIGLYGANIKREIAREVVVMSWYKHGSTSEERKTAKEEAPARTASRFWLNPEEEKRVIILDDEDFVLYEHHVKINGKWGNFFTCLKGHDGADACPLCMSGNQRRWTSFITVIDCTGFIGKDGKRIQYRRSLFPMTPTIADRFSALRSKKTTLVNCLVDLKRTSENAPRLGDIWDIVKEGVDVENDKKLRWKSNKDGKMHSPEPFEYIKIFAPKTESELKALASGAYSGDNDEAYKGGNYTSPDKGGDDDAMY